MAINPLTGLEEEDELSSVQNKYNTDSDALTESQSGYDTGGAIQGALAALSAGFQGRDAFGAVNQVQNQRREARKDQTSALDKWKAAKVQDIIAKRENEKAKRDASVLKNSDDATSGDSLAYEEQISKMFPTLGASIKGKSKTQIEALMPLLTAKIKGDQERETARIAANSPKKQFENLPEDKQLMITELAKKNAGKTSIKNQIEAVMSKWDTLPEDQKVATGRQLLKTLNSAEGADAIGAEEAKRLGGKLEFAMGNLSPWNSNPVQFGRDLKGFAEQARGAATSLGDAMKANQSEIDKAYGRAPAPDSGKPITKVVNGVTYKKVPGGWEELQAGSNVAGR